MVPKQVQYAAFALGGLAVVWLIWAYVLPRGSREPTVEQLREVLEKGPPDAAKWESGVWVKAGGDAPMDSQEEYVRHARAEAADRLGALPDRKEREESLPVLLKAMDDPDVLIRGRAGAAVQVIMGQDYQFRPDAPPEERKKCIDRITWDWKILITKEIVIPPETLDYKSPVE